jgi:Flp pilus assembly protein TadG
VVEVNVNKRATERGASLVEFAMVAPLLIMLVMGIIDFGWILSQNQDVRHGAREAARLAAVDAGSVGTMTTLVCDAMNVSSGATVTFDRGTGLVGATGVVTIDAPVTTLTGFSSLPFVGALYPTMFSETLTFRLEQAANWTNGSGVCP